MTDSGSARRLCGLLSDEARARTFAAVVLGASTGEAIAASSGLESTTVAKAVRQLTTGGLLRTDGATITADRHAFGDAAAGRSHDPGVDEPDAVRAAVLRNFLDDDGALKEFPASPARRLVVLEHIAGFFEIGVTYPERLITLRLKTFHPDHAALRRYLIDAGLLERRDGNYWRAGGPVDLAD